MSPCLSCFNFEIFRLRAETVTITARKLIFANEDVVVRLTFRNGPAAQAGASSLQVSAAKEPCACKKSPAKEPFWHLGQRDRRGGPCVILSNSIKIPLNNIQKR